jgi:hypothetical protein
VDDCTDLREGNESNLGSDGTLVKSSTCVVSLGRGFRREADNGIVDKGKCSIVLESESEDCTMSRFVRDVTGL